MELRRGLGLLAIVVVIWTAFAILGAVVLTLLEGDRQIPRCVCTCDGDVAELRMADDGQGEVEGDGPGPLWEVDNIDEDKIW